MTEKVKITKEQAAAIERYTEELYESLESQLKNENGLRSWAKCLVSLNAGKVMSAIIYGYEVEPEFEVGDWVKASAKRRDGNEMVCIGKILRFDYTEDGEKRAWAFWDSNYSVSAIGYKYLNRCLTSEEIAKEKERRWWSRHGRKVWELKKRDLLLYIETGVFTEVWSSQILIESKREEYKVICFAEDRKDLEGQV